MAQPVEDDSNHQGERLYTGDEPNLYFTRDILAASGNRAEFIHIHSTQGKDVLDEYVHLNERTDTFGHIISVIEQHDESTSTVNMSLVFPLAEWGMWASQIPGENLEVLWKHFVRVNAQIGIHADKLATGDTQELFVLCDTCMFDKKPSIRLTVHASADSEDDVTMGDIEPSRYFSDPVSYYGHISEQLAEKTTDVLRFLSYGNMQVLETYDMVCKAGPMDLATAVSHGNRKDFIHFSIGSGLTEDKQFPIVAEIQKGPRKTGPKVTMYVDIPEEIIRDLPEASADELNALWEAHNQALAAIRIPRADTVSSNGDSQLAYIFVDAPVEGANKNNKQLRLQLVEHTFESARVRNSIPLYVHEKDPYVWFTKSRKAFESAIVRLGAFVHQHDVRFVQSWRILATQASVALVKGERDRMYDHFQADVSTHEYRDAVQMDFYLTVQDIDTEKDGLWIMQAECAVGPAPEFPDIGVVNEETLQRLWNDFVKKKVSFFRSDVIKRNNNHELRIIPKVRYDDQGTAYYSLVAAEVRKNEIPDDAFCVNQFYRNHHEQVVSDIWGHMNQTMYAFEEFLTTQLEARARELFVQLPYTQPWVLEAISNNTLSPLVSLQLSEREIVDFTDRGYREAFVGTFVFNLKTPLELECALVYAPEDMGIMVRVRVPTTLSLSSSETNSNVTHANTIRVNKVIGEIGLPLFRSEKFQLKKTPSRAIPRVIFQRSEPGNPVYIQMHIEPLELLMLRQIGKHFWDELIMRELFQVMHTSVGIWMLQLENISGATDAEGLISL